jgi:hypothetical protein
MTITGFCNDMKSLRLAVVRLLVLRGETVLLPPGLRYPSRLRFSRSNNDNFTDRCEVQGEMPVVAHKRWRIV